MTNIPEVYKFSYWGVTMFGIGLLIGLFIGGVIGALVMALMAIGKKGDN